MKTFVSLGLRFLGLVMVFSFISIIVHYANPNLDMKELLSVFWDVILIIVSIGVLIILLVVGMYLIMTGGDLE